MFQPFIGFFLSALLLFISTTLAAPATQPAPATNPSTKPAGDVHVQAMIKSGDPQQIDKAIAEIYALVQKKSPQASGGFARYWGDPLLKQGRFAETVDIATQCVPLTAADAENLTEVQTLKVKALLALGKNQEALGEAKSLYNVTTMNRTGRSILLVCEALKGAKPDGAALAQRFKLEQLEAPDATEGAANTDGVLKSVTVNAAQYDAALEVQTGDTFNHLIEWGNLLLLSDRTAEAKKVFEAAYKTATDKQLPKATECLARTMRAQDGSVARANAWVLSLRPLEPAKRAATQPSTATAKGK